MRNTVERLQIDGQSVSSADPLILLPTPPFCYVCLFCLTQFTREPETGGSGDGVGRWPYWDPEPEVFEGRRAPPRAEVSLQPLSSGASAN